MPSARPVSTAGLTPTGAAERRKLLELTSFLLVKELANRSQHHKVYGVIDQIPRVALLTSSEVVIVLGEAGDGCGHNAAKQVQFTDQFATR
jgi:hypothetical protein